MPTTIKSAKRASAKHPGDGEPVRLKTREEVSTYLAKHLKPVRFGPKGQPIYALKDIENLNVLFPEDC
jgi:uncharacterized OB-fold protein